MVERLTYKSNGDTIFPHHLPDEIGKPDITEDVPGRSFSEKMDNFQKRLILSALLRSDWNLERAAEELGMELESFRQLCSEYNIGKHN